jgi:tRNA-Thr(GGU) m(6)t(6)A37 methyltransferase TsaA
MNERLARPNPASGSPQAAELRPGEVTAALPETHDETVHFIGTIRTPWASLKQCPKRGDVEDGPVCRIEVDARWREALAGIERQEWLQVLYWMHRARRDLVLQSPASDGRTHGTFALRSPNRPNPIASSVVRLIGIEGTTLIVRGLDCLDGTPLLDVKPDSCPQRAKGA